MKTISISQWVRAKCQVSGVRCQDSAAVKQNPAQQKRTKATKASSPLFASVLFLLSVLVASAQVNLPMGNLAPGEKVTLTFDVTLTNPFPASVTSVTNQGTITGSNFSPINTDDPQTLATNDATITLVEVPIPPPQLINPTKTNGGPFQFTFTSTAGQTFTVLASTNVVLPVTNWTILGPATEGPAGQFKFSDPQAITNSRRFYRVRWP